MDRTLTLNTFNTLGFFASRFSMSKVDTDKIIDVIPELINLVTDSFLKITPQMLESVFLKPSYCFKLCRDIDGHQVEQQLFVNKYVE